MTALAILLGVGAGAAYSRFFLEQEPILTKVAVGAIGAILGFVLVLMPGVVIRYLRKFVCRLKLTRQSLGLRHLLQSVQHRLRELLEKNEEDAAAWNALGIIELLGGRRPRAVHCLQRARELDAEEYDVNLAAALVESGDPRAAGELLLAAIERERDAEAAHHNLGVLLARRPPIGVVDYVLSEATTLSGAALLNSLGIYEMQAGRLELAEQHFTRASEADPVSPAPKANLGIVAYRRGRLLDALQKLSDAAYLDPLNPAIVNDLAALMCASGSPAKAIEQLSRASFLAPGSGAVELNRGCVRLALGHLNEALDSFSHPSVRTEHPLEAAQDASLALIGLGRYEDALAQARQGLERAPEDADLHTNVGCLAWALGDVRTMTLQMQRAAELAPDNVAVAVNLAVANLADGRVADSIDVLEALKKRHPSSLEISFHLGVAYLADALRLYSPDMGQRQREDFFRVLHRCTRPLEAVLDSASDYSLEARVNLSLYRYLRHDHEEAVSAIEAAVKEHPDDAHLRFFLGTCLAEQAMAIQATHAESGDELVGQAREPLRNARRHLEYAAEAGYDSPDLFCNLGVCLYNLGDMEAAKVAFRRMVQMEDSEEASNKLALVHAKEALKLQAAARAAALVSHERQTRLVMDMRAAISTALHYFMKALELNRTNPVLHGNIGLAYMTRNREGDVEAALRHWQLMRQTGGAASERRYRELTALVDPKKEAKAAFDETVMGFRPLDPRDCLTSVPPTPAGARYAVQPITEEMDWQFHTSDPMVQKALRQRERIVGLRRRLARLSV